MWLAIRNHFGLQIVYKKEVFLILSIALSATRRRKTFNTSLSHVLLQLARQFWYAILQPINLSQLTPTRSVKSFADWWKNAERRLPKQHRKGFNSLCILGAWILWKHRNACVFEGASPNLQVAVQAFKESRLWQFLGAKKLTALSPEMGAVQA